METGINRSRVRVVMNNLDEIEAWRLFLEEFGRVAG
jgi:hypothetical protein